MIRSKWYLDKNIKDPGRNSSWVVRALQNSQAECKAAFDMLQRSYFISAKNLCNVNGDKISDEFSSLCVEAKFIRSENLKKVANENSFLSLSRTRLLCY